MAPPYLPLQRRAISLFIRSAHYHPSPRPRTFILIFIYCILYKINCHLQPFILQIWQAPYLPLLKQGFPNRNSPFFAHAFFYLLHYYQSLFKPSYHQAHLVRLPCQGRAISTFTPSPTTKLPPSPLLSVLPTPQKNSPFPTNMPTSNACRCLPPLKAGLLSSARLFTRYISHTTNFATTSKIIYPPNMAHAIFAPATQGYLHFHPLAHNQADTSTTAHPFPFSLSPKTVHSKPICHQAPSGACPAGH